MVGSRGVTLPEEAIWREDNGGRVEESQSHVTFDSLERLLIWIRYTHSLHRRRDEEMKKHSCDLDGL